MRTATIIIKNMSSPRRGMDWNMLGTKVTGRTCHQNQRICLMREFNDFRFPLVHELTFDQVSCSRSIQSVQARALPCGNSSVDGRNHHLAASWQRLETQHTCKDAVVSGNSRTVGTN